MGLLKCAIAIAVIGIVIFIIGRILPPSWFREDRFPYRSLKWEKGGNIYNKIGIKKWQNKLPDMSKIFPQLMLEKKISGNYREELPLMIVETCKAEFIHLILCPIGLCFIWIWPGTGGIVVSVLYILSNIPFIIMQRYNRPRLVQLQRRLEKRNSRQEDN